MFGEVVSEDKGWLSGGGFGSGRTGSTNELASGDNCEEGNETEVVDVSGGGFGSGRNEPEVEVVDLSGGGFGSGRNEPEVKVVDMSGGGSGSGRNGTFPISDVHDSLYECSTVELLLELISSTSSNSLPFPR